MSNAGIADTVSELSIAEILKDLRSIKMSEKTRKFVNDSRLYFERCGALNIAVQRDLRKICKRYGKQLTELHAARERARMSNGLRRAGIKRAEAQRRVVARKNAERVVVSDVGF